MIPTVTRPLYPLKQAGKLSLDPVANENIRSGSGGEAHDVGKTIVMLTTAALDRGWQLPPHTPIMHCLKRYTQDISGLRRRKIRVERKVGRRGIGYSIFDPT